MASWPVGQLASWPIIGMFIHQARYVVFAKMFWSNQDPDPAKRKNPDPRRSSPTQVW